MEPSTRVLRWLKIISITGLVFQFGMGLLMFLAAIFWAPAGFTWVYLWFVLTIGVPMFGMLYVMIKLREYLRDIVGLLQKNSSS